MFTGLVESLSTVRFLTLTGQGAGLLGVDVGDLAGEIKRGDSIAINGVCLTVTQLKDAAVVFDVSSETLSTSSLGSLRVGSWVNIERALKVGDRMGGHFVQGHVDGSGVIKEIQRTGDFIRIGFSVDHTLLHQLVIKGSVGVDGISLTIAALHADSFSVAVIPETISRTTLGKAKVGDRVNIEVDILVKSIRRYLEGLLPSSSTLTVDKLRELGF